MTDRNPRCSEHSPIFSRAKDAAIGDAGVRGDPRYKTKKWANTRRAVLAHHLICQACEHAASTDCDHIVPPRDGGDFWHRDNLQGLCHECHASKTSGETRRRIALLQATTTPPTHGDG